jgi:hypothetical protein
MFNQPCLSTYQAIINKLLLAYATVGMCSQFCLAADEGDTSIVLRYEVDTSRLPPKTKADMRSLLLTITDRLPANAKVRRIGESGIEVTVVKKELAELDSLKRRITANGRVMFDRFVIGTDSSARRVIDAAFDLPKPDSEVKLKGRAVAKWVLVYSTDFDTTFLFDSNIVSRINKSHTEFLVWIDPEPLTGDYLSSAKKAFDDKEVLGIEFEFNKDGAKLLRRLTASGTEGRSPKQILGLFIDDRAYSGAVIQEKLNSRLFIGNLPEYEIDSVLSILGAGALPYRLKEMK